MTQSKNGTLQASCLIIVKDDLYTSYAQELKSKIESGVVKLMSESQLSVYIQDKISKAVDDATSAVIRQILLDNEKKAKQQQDYYVPVAVGSLALGVIIRGFFK